MPVEAFSIDLRDYFPLHRTDKLAEKLNDLLEIGAYVGHIAVEVKGSTAGVIVLIDTDQGTTST